MIIETQYFGAIEYEEADLFQFPYGIYGFEDYKNFLLIPFDQNNTSIYCLQNLEDSQLSFIVINPYHVDKDYTPNVSDEDKKTVHIKEDTNVTFLNICTIKDPLPNSTINMRCPLLINLDSRCGKQILLEEEQYTMRHPWSLKKEAN